MSSVVIAPVLGEHVALLVDLHTASFHAGWNAEAFVTLLQSPGVIGHIAFDESAPKGLGFVLLRIVADEAEILTLAVYPERRGLGIGRALVEAAHKTAGAAGARALFLEVGEHNRAARSLYDKAGFTPVGRRAGYYGATDGREDALVLRKRL